MAARGTLKCSWAVQAKSFFSAKLDGLVKSRIFPFFWIPVCTEMTIRHIISNRYSRRHTRQACPRLRSGSGHPVFMATFYESIKLENRSFHITQMNRNFNFMQAEFDTRFGNRLGGCPKTNRSRGMMNQAIRRPATHWCV